MKKTLQSESPAKPAFKLGFITTLLFSTTSILVSGWWFFYRVFSKLLLFNSFSSCTFRLLCRRFTLFVELLPLLGVIDLYHYIEISGLIMHACHVSLLSLMLFATNLIAVLPVPLPCQVPAAYHKAPYTVPERVIFSWFAFKFCEQLTGADDQSVILKAYISEAVLAIWSEYRLGKAEHTFIERDQQAAFRAELVQQGVAYKTAFIKTVENITHNKEHDVLLMKLIVSAYKSIIEIYAYHKEPLNIGLNEVHATLTSGSTLKNSRMMLVVIGFLEECLTLIERVENHRASRSKSIPWKKSCKQFRPMTISEYGDGWNMKIKFSDRVKFKAIELLGRLLEKIFPPPQSN